MNRAFEIHIESLTGPSYLPFQAEEIRSFPKKTVMQQLEKIKFLMDLGVKQAIMPPQIRPDIQILRKLGFEGTEAQILENVFRESPHLLKACSSPDAMWGANSATTTPSLDALDNRLHITPANLSPEFHRLIETQTTTDYLRKIFNNPLHFTIHDPLPFSDEGSANHIRFCKQPGSPGFHLFIFGRYALVPNALEPKRFPAKQSCEAQEAITRLHHINPERVIRIQQSPRSIDAGLGEGDMAAIGHENVFLFHELAFVGSKTIIPLLKKGVSDVCRTPLIVIEIAGNDLTLHEAAKTLFFNSELITTEKGEMNFICPLECNESRAVKEVIHKIIEDKGNPVKDVHYLPYSEIMRNRGGLARQRVKVVLSKEQLGAIHQGVLVNDELMDSLTDWVERHYRESLVPADLRDPKLWKESHEALIELDHLLGLSS